MRNTAPGLEGEKIIAAQKFDGCRALADVGRGRRKHSLESRGSGGSRSHR